MCANIFQDGVATLVSASVAMLHNVLPRPLSYAHHAVALSLHHLLHILCQSTQLKLDLRNETDVHHPCIQMPEIVARQQDWDVLQPKQSQP